jgi:crotonobetainyl-CoA:carnitine CoA-transferase CaiB-like acyl-CoA transferase
LLNIVPKRYGSSHADILPQGMFGASDGDIMFHVGTDRQFARFCELVMGDPGMAVDSRFVTNETRRQNRQALDELIAARLATRPRREWLPLFEKAGVPAGEVRNVLEALTSPEAVARGMVKEVDHPTAGRIRLVGNPIKLSRGALAEPLPPPLFGQHTDEILSTRLGCSASEIARLRAEGIVA